MSKRVHFSEINVSYSPKVPSLSPSISNSSLPSSSPSPEPVTPPPQTDFHPSPYPRSPYEQLPDLYTDVSPKHLEIHYLLAYSPFSGPPLQYDITTHPALIQDQFPAHALAEPATNPPMQTIIITCQYFKSKWDIHIRPAPTSSSPFVTVDDVLDAMYRGLRLPVHPIEYDGIPPHEASHVNAAYYTRCGRVLDQDARLQEHSKGVKRVDFLMGKNRFMGLAATLSGPETWELNIS